MFIFMILFSIDTALHNNRYLCIYLYIYTHAYLFPYNIPQMTWAFPNHQLFQGDNWSLPGAEASLIRLHTMRGRWCGRWWLSGWKPTAGWWPTPTGNAM